MHQSETLSPVCAPPTSVIPEVQHALRYATRLAFVPSALTCHHVFMFSDAVSIALAVHVALDAS